MPAQKRGLGKGLGALIPTGPPADVTIARNETLTFTNEDSFIHQIYVDGLFDSEEKGPGEVLNETFPRAGTFLVRCHIHPTMRLIVHVK